MRFFDNHGAASNWSAPVVFQTDINDQDSDGNGIPDHQELQGFTDIDGDGTADAQQNDIKCVLTEDGTSFVGISFKGSPTVTAVDSIYSEDPGSLLSSSASNEMPEYMPFGVINFKLLLTQPGLEAEVTVYLSEPAPEGSQWYKYDPVEEIWQNVGDYAQISADRRSVSLILEDGGFGDADGLANGIIVDPSGVGIAAAIGSLGSSAISGGSGGGGGGCFISSVADGQSPTAGHNDASHAELIIIFMLSAALALWNACRIRSNR